MSTTVSLFGLNLADHTLPQAAEHVIALAKGDERHTVHFVNAHCVNIAARDGDYYDALRASTTLYADGVGMRLSAKLIPESFRDNVNGTDLFPCLCQLAARYNVGIGLLGAAPGVAELAAENMKRLYPGLFIPFVRDGFFAEEDVDGILESINRAGIGVLLVALGVPKQELFIQRFRQQLEVPVAMGVGALFDFYSGRVRRAPVWIRRIGMEWFFRLAMEPRRLAHRYLYGNAMFLGLALARRIHGRHILQYKSL